MHKYVLVLPLWEAEPSGPQRDGTPRRLAEACCFQTFAFCHARSCLGLGGFPWAIVPFCKSCLSFILDRRLHPPQPTAASTSSCCAVSFAWKFNLLAFFICYLALAIVFQQNAHILGLKMLAWMTIGLSAQVLLRAPFPLKAIRTRNKANLPQPLQQSRRQVWKETRRKNKKAGSSASNLLPKAGLSHILLIALLFGSFFRPFCFSALLGY